MDALNTAIQTAGGVTKLADILGVRQNVVSNWRMREQVPEEYCAAIEIATGVRCEVLRPDLIWQRDDLGKVTGHFVPVPAPAAIKAA